MDRKHPRRSTDTLRLNRIGRLIPVLLACISRLPSAGEGPGFEF